MTTDGRVPWDQAVKAMGWRQGEHVSLIAPTGGGKTTLALALMPQRNYTVVLGTKPADETLSSLFRHGWTRIGSWSERPSMTPGANGKIPDQRLVLWPKFRRIEDQAKQVPVFDQALREMFVDGRWTLFADEVYHLTKTLGLGPVLTTWWNQGRSLKLSLVAATQRPAWVPLEIYSAATHLFVWRTNDRNDLDRLRSIDSAGQGNLRAVIQRLDWEAHEVAYFNTRTRTSLVTIPPKAG